MTNLLFGSKSIIFTKIDVNSVLSLCMKIRSQIQASFSSFGTAWITINITEGTDKPLTRLIVVCRLDVDKGQVLLSLRSISRYYSVAGCLSEVLEDPKGKFRH